MDAQASREPRHQQPSQLVRAALPVNRTGRKDLVEHGQPEPRVDPRRRRAQQEPLRLGRRYLTTNAAFILMVARQLVRDRAGNGPTLSQMADPRTAETGEPATLATPQTTNAAPGEAS